MPTPRRPGLLAARRGAPAGDGPPGAGGRSSGRSPGESAEEGGCGTSPVPVVMSTVMPTIVSRLPPSRHHPGGPLHPVPRLLRPAPPQRTQGDLPCQGSGVSERQVADRGGDAGGDHLQAKARQAPPPRPGPLRDPDRLDALVRDDADPARLARPPDKDAGLGQGHRVTPPGQGREQPCTPGDPDETTLRCPDRGGGVPHAVVVASAQRVIDQGGGAARQPQHTPCRRYTAQDRPDEDTPAYLVEEALLPAPLAVPRRAATSAPARGALVGGRHLVRPRPGRHLGLGGRMLVQAGTTTTTGRAPPSPAAGVRPRREGRETARAAPSRAP